MLFGISLSSMAFAEENIDDLKEEIYLLKQRLEQLEGNQTKSFEKRHGELIKQLVEQYAKDAQSDSGSGITAGYKKGFFIKSDDDKFKLQINTRLQFRHSYQLADEHKGGLMKDGTPAPGSTGVDTSASGFELERARMYFKGHVNKKLKYMVALSMGDDDAITNNTRLYEYILSYAFNSKFGLKVGRLKGPFGKAETTSSGRQQLIDRSLANEIFNLSRMTGIEAFGKLNNGAVYRVGVFNGFQGDTNVPIGSNDNTPAFAGRLVIPLNGSKTSDFKNESDLAYHENPVSQIGFSAAYSNDRDEDNFAPGSGQDDNYEFLARAGDGRTDIYELGGEATLIGIDYAWKHEGKSLTIEGFYQHINADSGELGDEGDFGTTRPAMVGDEFDNYGWSCQGGLFLVPKKFEIVGRVSGVCVDNSNGSYEFAGGWNWYLDGQNTKLSMDVTYIDDLPLVSGSPNFDGIQNNSLLLVRSQLQFQF